MEKSGNTTMLPTAIPSRASVNEPAVDVDDSKPTNHNLPIETLQTIKAATTVEESQEDSRKVAEAKPSIFPPGQAIPIAALLIPPRSERIDHMAAMAACTVCHGHLNEAIGNA